MNVASAQMDDSMWKWIAQRSDALMYIVLGLEDQSLGIIYPTINGSTRIKLALGAPPYMSCSH